MLLWLGLLSKSFARQLGNVGQHDSFPRPVAHHMDLPSPKETTHSKESCITVGCKTESWEETQLLLRVFTRHSSKHFPYICSFNPHNNPNRQIL